MAKKLESVRRSLFKEFDAKEVTPASKINNTFITAAVIIMASIAALNFTIAGNRIILIFLKDIGSDVWNKIDGGIKWIEMDTCLTQSLICSVLITTFTMSIIYFDSEIPGISPPTPFSPRKAQKMRYSRHKERTNQLSLLVSICSGVVTFFLLYL